MELSDELRRFQSEVEFLKLLANKALDMAMDALVKVQAMKESTHQVIPQPISPLAEDFIKEVKAELQPESEPVPLAKPKLSPYNLSTFRRAPVPEPSDEDLTEGDAA